jgi:hypothetical protein
VLIWCAADHHPVACYYDSQGGPDNKPRWVVAEDGAEIMDGDALAWMPIAAPWCVLDPKQKDEPMEHPTRTVLVPPLADAVAAISDVEMTRMCLCVNQMFGHEEAVKLMRLIVAARRAVTP